MRNPRVKQNITMHCDSWIEMYYCSKCKFIIQQKVVQCPNCKAQLIPFSHNSKIFGFFKYLFRS